jgi:hypothetical protein
MTVLSRAAGTRGSTAVQHPQFLSCLQSSKAPPQRNRAINPVARTQLDGILLEIADG